MADSRGDLSGLSEAEVGALAAAAVAELAARGTTESFRLLIELSAEVGRQLGESARRVAEHGSWSQVADVSGTTKQAAWSRWRTP